MFIGLGMCNFDLKILNLDLFRGLFYLQAKHSAPVPGCSAYGEASLAIVHLMPGILHLGLSAKSLHFEVENSFFTKFLIFHLFLMK